MDIRCGPIDLDWNEWGEILKAKLVASISCSSQQIRKSEQTAVSDYSKRVTIEIN